MDSELQTYVKQYEAATRRFEELVSNLVEADLDTKHQGGWSPRQIIHHVADSEAQSYARIRRLIAEPIGSLIQGYDEAAWAENPILGYEVLDISASMAVFSAVRASTLEILKRLNESDLERHGEHSESGNYVVREWFEDYVAHPDDHGDQLKRALQGLL